MPSNCEDSDQTQPPEHTPAYQNGFGPNTHKLQHLVRFSAKATEHYTAEVKALTAELAGVPAPQAAQLKKNLEKVRKQFADGTSGALTIHEMMPVLFVTLVEAWNATLNSRAMSTSTPWQARTYAYWRDHLLGDEVRSRFLHSADESRPMSLGHIPHGA